jgi:branched-chain amino acid transport system substrate-binding protein
VKAKMSLVAVVLLIALVLASCAPAATPAPTQAPEPTAAPQVSAPTEAVAAAEPTKAVDAAPEATPTKEYPPAPEFIEFGASIPLTGKFGSLGSQVKVGYDYAIDAINADGGVYVEEYGKKIPLRLTSYDDESDPTKAVSNLENVFSEKDVVAYLGGAASGMHAATTAIAEKNKVPYCGVSFAWWNIHQRGYKYLFSPFPKSPDQARDVFMALNELVPADQRPTKIAIFQEKTDWGNELGGLFKADAKPAGYEVVYYGEYAPATTDFSTLILDAKAAEADMLLGMPSTPDGMAIVKQMSELGWTPKFTMLVRAPDAATWGESLGAAGDYISMFAGWHSGENFPGIAEINAKHEAEFGRPADILVGPAYACVQSFADSIERAGTLDRDAIRDAMAATNMDTVIGPVSYNADGTGNVLNPLVQWQDGKMELVWPVDQKTADFQYPAPPFDQR